jgi:serine/threonine protein phosphatase PrpC
MNDDRANNVSRFSAKSRFPGSLDAPPPSADVDVEFGAQTRRGPQRAINDDHYLILRLGRHEEVLMTSLPDGEVPQRFDEYGYGMVVADGIGTTGEIASRLAISTLVHLAIYFGKWHVRVDDPIAEEMIDRARRFYQSVDSLLVETSQFSSDRLQTTLTAIYTAGSELFFAHVGHSRAYVFRDGQLMQLTRDHTAERERHRSAAIGEVTRDLHHLVTQSLGGPGSAAPRIDVERCGLLHGDMVLLCTNGLTDVASDAQIATVLRLHRTPDDQCRALVDLAVNSGSQDDVTVLAAHYRIASRSNEE